MSTNDNIIIIDSDNAGGLTITDHTPALPSDTGPCAPFSPGSSAASITNHDDVVGACTNDGASQLESQIQSILDIVRQYDISDEYLELPPAHVEASDDEDYTDASTTHHVTVDDATLSSYDMVDLLEDKLEDAVTDLYNTLNEMDISLSESRTMKLDKIVDDLTHKNVPYHVWCATFEFFQHDKLASLDD